MRIFISNGRAEAGGKSVARRAASVLIGSLLICSALLLAGCDDSDDLGTSSNTNGANTAATASSQGGAKSSEGGIKADPNPVPAGAGNGKTKISWSTKGDLGGVEVHVSENGQPENLLAQGAEGAVDAPWIQTGVNYEFRLYAGKGANKRLIDKVQVTRAQ